MFSDAELALLFAAVEARSSCFLDWRKKTRLTSLPILLP